MSRAEGDNYELKAEQLLNQAGLRTVARNWQCRYGEIDLIMQEDATLVFVEVRKRNSTRFGSAAESISASKQQRLQSAIALYLSGQRSTPPCRVDAVLFEPNQAPQWLRNILN